MNALTYASVPLLNEPGSMFSLPWGSTPGHGVFDVDAKGFAKIQAALATSGGCADLILADERGGKVTLQEIYLVSASPAIVKPGAPGQDVVSWRLTLADKRRVFAMRTISGRYNIFKPSRLYYFPDTTQGEEDLPWSWQDIVDVLVDAFGLELPIVGTPAGNPADLVWDSDAPLSLLDELLAEIGQYLVYSPISDSWNVWKTGTENADERRQLDELIRTARLVGAAGVKVQRALCPASVDVCFPIYDTSLAGPRLDPNDRWYRVNVAAPQTVKTSGGSKLPIFYNHAYALREGSTVTNGSALATIAAARAAEFYSQFACAYADYELSGIQNLAPNSVIRRVIWVSDEGGARTLVRVHNPELLSARESKIQNLKSKMESSTEGGGLFLQRGRRPRLEAERTSFIAKTVSHVTAHEYKLRRINSAGVFIGAEFSAFHFDSVQTTGNGVKVRVESDGEGNFVFAPFDRGFILLAASADNFATLDEADDERNAQGDARLYFEDVASANERQALVLFDRPLGSAMEIDRLIVDCFANLISGEQKLILKAETFGPTGLGGGTASQADAFVIGVTPILTEFDPAGVTWKSVYTDEPLSFGTEIEAVIASVTASATVAQMGVTFTLNETEVEVPELLVLKGWHTLDPFNTEDAVYGLRLRLVEPVGDWKTAQWDGNPSHANSWVYAVRKIGW